mmetsp:Transcript_67258/g.186321  ORF Transcript_67258/g.186321 Transcript_67258/m.186321 type:complete len:294 (-) Transcript_67258:113-994(-)
MKELAKPAAMSTTFPSHCNGSETCDGIGQSLHEPRPSWPRHPTPKAKTRRSSARASVWCQPQATRVTLGSPSTARAVGFSSPALGTCTAASSSHDHTSPSLVTKSVCDSPAPQETTRPKGRLPVLSTRWISRASSSGFSFRRPGSTTGSLPAAKQRPLGSETKTEWVRPPSQLAIFSPANCSLRAPIARAGALTKTSLPNSPPIPSWPSPLAPQARTWPVDVTAKQWKCPHDTEVSCAGGLSQAPPPSASGCTSAFCMPGASTPSVTTFRPSSPFTPRPNEYHSNMSPDNQCT